MDDVDSLLRIYHSGIQSGELAVGQKEALNRLLKKHKVEAQETTTAWTIYIRVALVSPVPWVDKRRRSEIILVFLVILQKDREAPLTGPYSYVYDADYPCYFLFGAH